LKRRIKIGYFYKLLHMAKKIILTTKERHNFEIFFGKGLSVAGGILINLRECGEEIMENIMEKPFSNGYKKYWTGYRFTNQKPSQKTIGINLSRLEKQGLIVKNKKDKVLYLSKEGKKIMVELENRKAIFEKPWDKKFRLVFFDIPEKKRSWRRWLIKELTSCRFLMLQKSTYIGKYPLPDSFYQEIIRQDLGENVFVITAGEIDKQDEVLRMFQK